MFVFYRHPARYRVQLPICRWSILRHILDAPFCLKIFTRVFDSQRVGLQPFEIGSVSRNWLLFSPSLAGLALALTLIAKIWLTVQKRFVASNCGIVSSKFACNFRPTVDGLLLRALSLGSSTRHASFVDAKKMSANSLEDLASVSIRFISNSVVTIYLRPI